MFPRSEIVTGYPQANQGDIARHQASPRVPLGHQLLLRVERLPWGSGWPNQGHGRASRQRGNPKPIATRTAPPRVAPFRGFGVESRASERGPLSCSQGMRTWKQLYYASGAGRSRPSPDTWITNARRFGATCAGRDSRRSSMRIYTFLALPLGLPAVVFPMSVLSPKEMILPLAAVV
jgi:hypothetical protein